MPHCLINSKMSRDEARIAILKTSGFPDLTLTNYL